MPTRHDDDNKNHKIVQQTKGQAVTADGKTIVMSNGAVFKRTVLASCVPSAAQTPDEKEIEKPEDELAKDETATGSTEETH